MKIEYHPFEPFVPNNAKYLILGSFPGKESTQRKVKDDWFYGSKKNQFWEIIGQVYGEFLKTKKEKQNLFKKLRIAITDIILSCERRKNDNSDSNLTNITYNLKKIRNILKNNKIEKVLFTSQFVEKNFNVRILPELNSNNIEFVRLLSPSSRANIPISKTADYKDFFKRNPNLKIIDFKIKQYKKILLKQ